MKIQCKEKNLGIHISAELIFRFLLLSSFHLATYASHLNFNDPSQNFFWICLFLFGLSPFFCTLWLPCHSVQFSSVQSLSRVQHFATPWIAARQASLSITNSQSSLRLTSIESVMTSSHLILCRPLLLLPPIPPSIRVFSNESTLRMRWPKYWSFSFSIIPSQEIPGLISFRMDWLDLLAVQGKVPSFWLLPTILSC